MLDEESIKNRENTETFVYLLLDQYFKRSLDDMGIDYVLKYIKGYLMSCEWYEVYDFLEFVVNTWPDEKINKKFMEVCNKVLEEENAGYRFVNGKIVPIYEESEISEIETAFENVKPWTGIYHDLSSALKYLSDRRDSNYKESVEASIKAVEGVAKLITHRHGTLGELLPKVQKILELNENLASAIGKLWRYANEVARHSDPEGKKMPEFEEAKFIFVTSSAIINYLISKSDKKGVELKLEQR
ncbi:AbiJ-NTD4 domain-containing protein [Thermococcus sp. JCM 11816]|uniref:AbiJ-NTD4 domain-containing protein n=1 Tax=Thermococcus sp. (strain JCM 11816 / KS-1) TaxID=1295125 RepID=UPI0006D02EB3